MPQFFSLLIVIVSCLLQETTRVNWWKLGPGAFLRNVCAETMGIWEALSSTKAAERLNDVIVETDCFAAVQAIRHSAAMTSYFGVIKTY